jgi:hypothetical protein
MSAFQILDSAGVPVTLHSLDLEVCALIGNDVDDKYYCLLAKESELEKADFVMLIPSWYDIIGWMIAYEGKSFEDIINHLKRDLPKESADVLVRQKYPGLMLVLDTWIAKGYVAKQVKE